MPLIRVQVEKKFRNAAPFFSRHAPKRHKPVRLRFQDCLSLTAQPPSVSRGPSHTQNLKLRPVPAPGARFSLFDKLLCHSHKFSFHSSLVPFLFPKSQALAKAFGWQSRTPPFPGESQSPSIEPEYSVMEPAPLHPAPREPIPEPWLANQQRLVMASGLLMIQAATTCSARLSASCVVNSSVQVESISLPASRQL